MIAKYGKRVLSFFLAMIMIISAVPVQVFAEETHDHEEEEIVVTSETEESSEEASLQVLSEEPEEEPSEEPEEEPSEEPEEEPSEEPEEEPSEEPEEEPSEEPEEEPSEEPEEEPSEEPEEEPSEEPEEEPSEEPEVEPSEEPEEEPSEEPVDAPEGGVTIDSLRAEIAAYIEKLGITPDMPDQYLLYAYGNHASYEEAQASLTKLEEFVEKGKQLSEEEQKALLKETNVKLCARYYEVASNPYGTAMGGEATINGIHFSTSGTFSSGANTVTVSATASKDNCGDYTAASVTLYIKNKSGEKGTVSFDMTQNGINAIKADSEDIKGSTKYSKVLEPEGEFSITITTGEDGNKNELILTNIAFTAANQAFTVTVEYPTDDGSVTTSVAGESVDADGTTTITIPEINAVDGVTLTANSSTFLCWVDKDNKLLSKDKTLTVKPSADTTVKALMNSDVAHFVVNGNLVYGDLNAAVDMVETASNKTIVLMNNGTLPAGDYTIPSGVTLLIPYNDANTLCTTAPTVAESGTTAPTAYRTLTMAEGANITVEGALSLAATQSAGGGKSNPIGPTSFIKMESGSNITVRKGGNLYAWGYITGSGSVTIKSGATVYECFQVMDWRGGDNTSGMVGNEYRVFPFSQYYVQNVEVPMTLEAGATEKGYMSIAITMVGVQSSAVPFIGDGGMFNIESGHIIKDYNESNGRLEIDVYGKLGVNSLSISMKLGLLGSKTINSKDYVLPINGNITVAMHSGGSITMTQDIALHPGAKLILDEGATCTLGSGNKIYIYDYDQWTTEVAADAVQEGPSFCGTPDTTHINLSYPASAKTVAGRTEDACVEINGTADLSAGYVYTTSGGANIFGTGTIIMKPDKDTVTYQVKNTGSDNKTDKWVSIPVTSAKLQNADGSYVETAGAKGKVIYKSVDGVWTCEHTYATGTYQEEVTTPATCEAKGLKTLTCNCGDHSKTEEIAALGHAYEAVVTAPTCTTDGYTTHTCENDPTHKYTDTPVAALGHTAGAAATCTTAQTCTVCGAEMVAALGHDEVDHEAKAPTCTENGWDAYVTCSRCDYTTYVEKTSLGHDELAHEAKVPTCTEVGWDAYVTCKRCDYSTYVEKAVLPHSWEWITDEDATVLNPGVKHEECSVCHAKQNENTEIPVLKCPHTGTMTITPAKDSTCSETGNTRYSYCSACQNYYSDDAGQHEIEKDSWIIDAKGHAEVDHAAKDPTCTEIGWDAYVTCARCDYTTYAEKAALGHKGEPHDAKAPTCTEPGWDAYVACTRCDYTNKVEQPAKGHGPMEEVAAVAATCQKEGIVAHWRCTACGMTFEDQAATKQLESVAAPIDPENHTWAENGEETKATCQAEGKIVYPCVNEGCEETNVVTLPVDPEGHVWDEGVPFGNHSCNSASYLIYTCTLCQVENKVVVEEQHFRVPIAEEIPATCTEDGMTSGWKCEKCHEFWIPQEVIPALGHDWNGNIPCQSDASACTRCDLHFDTRQEHLVIVDSAVPATCTETGLTEGSHCGYCGEVLVAQTVVPVTDHNWIVADMEIPATCGAAGHKEGASYCLDCNYDADPIAPLEHEWMHRDAKKATYSAIGWNAHDYCLLCKATKTTEEYEAHPCEFCGENTEGYIEIPKVEVQKIATAEEVLTNIGYLEMMAAQYAVEHPGTDPLALVLNYMRTGVENYTSGSWAIMAGPEDKDFLKYVQDMEDAINAAPDIDVWVNVSGLKKLGNYTLSNEINPYTNNKVPYLSGHFFGTMDMTYHNKGSQNHADVGGWVGDLTDLLSTSDEHGVSANLTLEEKVAYVRQRYLFANNVSGSAGSFGSNDLYADLDAYYFMNELIANGYKTGDLERMMREYYGSNLTLKNRISYLLTNRLDGLSTRQDLRTAVYNAYTSNKLISTLEGTRNFNTSGNELAELRKAVCYAFADELCYHAGDYVEDLTNPRFTIFDSETKILAPGVSQQINYATNADGKQIVYYVATADVNRDDVGVWVNYYDRDPGTPENPVWKNSSVLNSAQNAQERYGDPTSPDYIANFSVIASTNAGGYSMQEDATPGGLMVMNGVEWYPNTNSAGFFAILDDGTAYMGTRAEYETMKDQIQEAIGGFGEFVVQDGVVTGSATYSDAPRTSVGITSTGRVVIMCIDGRQAPFSSGASLQDVGYIMKEAGCVVAINLDGGGSTTFVARQPGSEELTIMNRPSDGYPRNVSTDLLIYSTAPSSTAFDHAVIESEYDYATINTPVQMTAAGVSPSGNAVDVPEGAVWTVGDEAWGSITEDGVFTGKRLGEVRVYLMLDGKEIGNKLMTITNPDQLYFERAKVDAIYGSSVKLPLRARYEGKAIAINPNDVRFTLSAPAAGTMDGFTFRVADSTVKTLSITAALSEDNKASINVMLYKQGENSFDFDKATGGDRTLAWYREVSNAKLEDGNIYNVIDPAKDMVTSYTFAMDMTTIPIPERIAELTYMLPGGTMEGATAWSFLLSLAQRISDMSWVKATIDFDDRFNVDYSELKILNDYFTMKELTFDEATNTLSVTMSWIKQSQVIDEATANPLCLISGFKLTPKDGVWEDVSKIDAVTSGKIGYEIYMRASGLYGFAQKPENQAVFGIYPYRNPNDTSDAGGYFRDTYADITDEYTLVNVVKEGWVNEDGGFAYYVNGERLTGVQEVEGFYYDFGEKGVNVGQTKFTGLFYDEEAKVYRYSHFGELADGWQSVGGKWYYFKNLEAVTGNCTVGGVSYEFNEDGSLVSGVWMSTFVGMRYYYGPKYYTGWAEIDGNWYYFHSSGDVATGIKKVCLRENGAIPRWHEFAEDGIFIGLLNGIYETNGNTWFYEEGAVIAKGLVKINGEYYCTDGNGALVTGRSYYAWKTACDMPVGTYYFGEDGRMAGVGFGEVVKINDVLYYYENGRTAAKGLVCVDGDYYFADGNGKLIVNQRYSAWKTSCDMPAGSYYFGEDGKMVGAGASSIVTINGVLYYYENGIPVNKGLFRIGDDYYYAKGDGRLAVNERYSGSKTSCDMPAGNYYYDAEGKLIGAGSSEIVLLNGKLFYFEHGIAAGKGLVCVNGEYYFANGVGELIVDQRYYAWKTACDMPVGNYYFDAEGKLIGSADGEIVSMNGKLYYYERGAVAGKGLVCVDGEYYFATGTGELIIDQRYYAWKTACDMPVGNYYFGADGRLVGGKNGEIVSMNGKLYYYERGAAVGKGLVCVNGEYYFANGVGELIVDQRYYAWKTACDMPVGNYNFDANGKLIGAKNGEIVSMNGKLYYYERGVAVGKGLVCVDGEYYFANGVGELIVNQRYYAWKTACDMPVGNYYFDANGKLIGAKNGEIVSMNGKLHYYERGIPVGKGLVCVDGEYYFANGVGELIIDQRYYVWKTNCDMPVGNYYFDAEGKLIGAKNGEIVSLNGKLYYYERGVPVGKGLVYVDGYYYFANGVGELIVNTTYYVWKNNGLLAEKNYRFNELGQIVG